MDSLDTLFKMTDAINGQLKDKINPEDIISKELSDVIDFKLWLETVEIQKKFNDSVAPGWMLDLTAKKYDYWMAILDETVEVLNSRHWKWWKNGTKMGEVDWENIQVELIDLFHFILSLAIQHDMHSTIFTQLVNMEMNAKEMFTDPKKKYFEDFWETFLMGVQMKNLVFVIVKWAEFWYRAGGDANKLFFEYRIKAALNNIRQEFGYGEKNTYQKLWVDMDTGEKVEDNIIAWKLSRDVPLNENTTSILTEKLREYYLKHMAI